MPGLASLSGAPIPGQRPASLGGAGLGGLSSLPSNEPLGRVNMGTFNMEDPGYDDDFDLGLGAAPLGEAEDDLDAYSASPQQQRGRTAQPAAQPKAKDKSKSRSKDKKDKKGRAGSKDSKKSGAKKQGKGSGGQSTTTATGATTTSSSSAAAKKTKAPAKAPSEEAYTEDYEDDDFIAEAPPLNPVVESSEYSEGLGASPTPRRVETLVDQHKAELAQGQALADTRAAQKRDEELEKRRQQWEAQYGSGRGTAAPAAATPTKASPVAAPAARPQLPASPVSPAGFMGGEGGHGAPQAAEPVDAPAAARLQHQHQQQQQPPPPPQQHAPAAAPAAGAAGPSGEPGEVPQYYRDELEREKWRMQKELFRRQRRALERRKQHVMAEEEVAASSLMKRLASDVKTIFQELNLAIVAAERDRHEKEERYRRDREARDRQYAEERAARDERDRREQQAASERFFAFLEEQERKREEAEAQRTHNLARDAEAQASGARDAEERKALREAEHRAGIEKLERERRDQEDAAFREREQAGFKMQLETYQRASRQQTDELQMKMQSELEHIQEMRRLEMENLQKRHDDALTGQKEQYDHSLKIYDVHRANSDKLQGLVDTLRHSIDAVGALNEKANEGHTEALREREAHLHKQLQLQAEMQAQVAAQREEVDKERQRLHSLYVRFEGCIGGFTERHTEELRNLQEAQVRANNMRDIVEEQRMRHAKEMNGEMLALEAKRGELDEERFKWLQEVQQQRMDLGRERADVTKVIEQTRRDERHVHEAKQALAERAVESATDTSAAEEKKRYIEAEYKRLETYKEETVEALNNERSMVEQAKRQVELLMLKADESGREAARLRQEAAKEKAWAEETQSKFEEERYSLNMIRKKVDHDKSKLRDEADRTKAAGSAGKENNVRGASGVAQPAAYRDPTVPAAFTGQDVSPNRRAGTAPAQQAKRTRGPAANPQLSFAAQEQHAFLMSIKEDIIHN